MPITLGLLLTTSLLAQGTPPSTPASGSPITIQQPQSQGGADPTSSPQTPTERPHQIGIGGFGGSGSGASFRYFMNDRIGIDTNIGWSLGGGTGQSRGSNSNSGGNTFRASQSAVFMLTKSHQLADLDIRPYVGGGLNYARTPTSTIQTSSTAQLRASGLGMQVFGGAELSFLSAPSIAISAEVAYYKLAVQPVNLVTTSGTNFYLLFHYYMR